MTDSRPNPRRRALRAALLTAALLLPALLFAQPPGAGEKKPTGEGKKQEAGKDVEGGWLETDELSPADKRDPQKPDHYARIYSVKMIGGRRYVIDMASGDFDAYLRLLDASGRQLAFNDDNGAGQNSRIEFDAPKTDTYRIVATTFKPRAAGKFTLEVTSLAPGEAPPPVPGRVGGAGPGIMPGDKPGRGLTDRETFGQLTITAEAPLLPRSRIGNDDSHGYLEYRLTIRNESAEPHRVTVSLPRSGYGGGGNYLRALRRTVEVGPGPGARATLSLFHPELPLAYSGTGVEVEIDGQVQDAKLALIAQTNRSREMGYGGGPGGGGPGARALAHILAPSALAFTLDTHDPQTVFTPAPDPEKWATERWLGFSCFEGVALSGKQFEQLPAATREALCRFVECGGSLLLLGTAEKLPPGWTGRQDKVPGLTAYYPGFGQCLVAQKDGPSTLSPDQRKAILNMWERSARLRQTVLSPNDANTAFPVIENRSVPVRGLFAGMLVFAVLVGPVNIYWLTRKKRRIWLLWTVPAFSLLTCAVVFGVMILSEGWSGHVRVTGVTVLDENTERAASVGWLGVYSPITPGDGLHFGHDTEVTPHLRLDYRYGYRYREGSGRTIDWTNDQHFASGWVKPLVPAHFSVRSNEHRKERLTVRREPDGSLKAVNALGADLLNLWLADGKGIVYTAENVPAGKEATLKKSALRAEGKEGALREKAYAGDWLRLSKGLPAHPQEVLRPGTYLAVLDGAPFLEKGLRGARQRPGRSVVFGIRKK